jgi:hypothetical protein
MKKIVKENQNLMIIKDRKILAFFIEAIFVLIGLIIIFYPEFFNNRPPREVGIGFFLWGLLVISLTQITTITLDKTANKLTIVIKSLFGKKMEEQNLNQIKAIELRTNYYQGKEAGEYQLFFILENNEEIPLPPGEVVKVMGKQITNERIIGARIASFLNIQFQERKPPSLSEALSVIQKTIQKEIEKHRKE